MSELTFLLLPLLAVPIVLLFRFLGCGSFETGPHFAIKVEPASATANQGASAAATVTITSGGGYNSPVTLSITSSPDVNAQFVPNPVTPPANATAQSTVTLSVSGSAATGPREITISGNDGSTYTHNVKLTLTINAGPPPPPPPPPIPDFTLSLTPPAATVARGQMLTLTININRTGGFAGAVTLSSNVGGNITPNPASGTTATFSIPVPANQPTGPTPLTITGLSGALTRSVSATITVT